MGLGNDFNQSQGHQGEFEPGMAKCSIPNCFDGLFLIRTYLDKALEALVAMAALGQLIVRAISW